LNGGNSAHFSPDGKRIVTGSVDAACIWDAQSGQPLTGPMKHDGGVNSAEFSPDGKRIVTATIRFASAYNTVQVWDISPRGQAPAWLPRLAEAVAGQHLNDRGVFEPLNEDEGRVLEEIRAQLSSDPGDDDWTIIGRWFLADPSTRTISPFSKITVPEYIENRIKENTPESLDEAERLAIGNAELLKSIAEARTQREPADATIANRRKNPPQPASLLPQKSKDGVLFQCYAPEARVIYLAGDFNDWANNRDTGYITDKQFAMQGPDEKGIWRKVVKLAPGKHLFKFCFDGDAACWFTPDAIADRDGDDNGIFTVTEKGDVVVNRKPE
jgi:WD40 repeat protein